MVVSSIKTEPMHLEQITNVKESHGQTALQEPPTFPHRSTEYVHTHTHTIYKCSKGKSHDGKLILKA